LHNGMQEQFLAMASYVSRATVMACPDEQTDRSQCSVYRWQRRKRHNIAATT
jgi:hypothetical protein